MKKYKREGWRTCENCVHNNVCYEPNKNKECNYHIYNANPARYGDIEEILSPLQEWLQIHYPMDGYFVVRNDYAGLMLEHKEFFKEY